MNIILYMSVRFFCDIRIKYVKAYYIIRPSVFKLCELLKTKSKKDLNNFGKYIKEAFEIRKSLEN